MNRSMLFAALSLMLAAGGVLAQPYPNKPVRVVIPWPPGVLPAVPTVAEAGVPGYEMNPWIAVFAPAGTSRDIINRLNAEITKALKLPDVSQSLASQALDPWTSSPEEFDARLKADYEKYAKLIKLTSAKIE